jgi:16S rRNA (guanine(966)-N(2))-methyltransferase RsmD
MLRVSSGIAKGKKLAVPDIKGFKAIQDKAKLAIFSILGEKVVGAKCLDLYAGSGSLGIEALSRGARFCDFVDKSRKAEDAILKNLKGVGFEDQAEVYRQDAVKFVGNAFDKYDIVFIDPFYKEIHFRYLFENLEKLLNDSGAVIFSHGKETDIEDALANTTKLKVHAKKRYGSAYVTVIVEGE